MGVLQICSPGCPYIVFEHGVYPKYHNSTGSSLSRFKWPFPGEKVPGAGRRDKPQIIRSHRTERRSMVVKGSFRGFHRDFEVLTVHQKTAGKNTQMAIFTGNMMMCPICRPKMG
jgi:hypothetical protein